MWTEQLATLIELSATLMKEILLLTNHFAVMTGEISSVTMDFAKVSNKEDIIAVARGRFSPEFDDR